MGVPGRFREILGVPERFRWFLGRSRKANTEYFGGVEQKLSFQEWFWRPESSQTLRILYTYIIRYIVIYKACLLAMVCSKAEAQKAPKPYVYSDLT